VTDLAYDKSQATHVLGMVSLGGVVGSIAVSFVSRVVSIKPLMVLILVLFAADIGLKLVALIMAFGPLIVGLVVIFLPKNNVDETNQ